MQTKNLIRLETWNRFAPYKPRNRVTANRLTALARLWSGGSDFNDAINYRTSMVASRGISSLITVIVYSQHIYL